jgi:predicted CxxxxCH...CXXCH cytochrome family protein
MATDASPTGSHLKHANTTSGMNVPCGYCHQDGGDGTAIHADGSVFVNFTSYIGGSYSAGSPYLTGVQKVARSVAFGTCAATFCHGTSDSPVWGSPGPLVCNTCHSAKVDDVSWSGNHKTHYNYSTMPTSYTQTVQDLSNVNRYRFNCAHCHDDNVSKHSLKPQSANSAARVFFGISTATPVTSSRRGTYSYGAPSGSTDNGFKYTNGVCNASYCHSNGRGGAPFNTSLTWTTAKSAGTNCTLCHDTSSKTSTATQLSGKHDKHMNPLNNSIMGTGNGFKCRDCHARTIASFSNLSISNKGKHVNAFLDYSGLKSGKNHDGITKVCSNVYCHSNGNPSAIQYAAMTGTMAWNGAGTITTCNQCHGTSNAYGYPDYANGGANNATSNLHAGHMAGLTDTTACADCHRKTGETAVPNRFRPYSTLHLSGGPNVVFNKTKSYIGNNAAVNTAGFQVTCSNLVCHGQGAPVWGDKKAGSGNPGVRTCTKCHGTTTTADYLTNYSSSMIAPGYNNEGTDTTRTKFAATDPRVGAHQRHLESNVIAAKIKCSECHVLVNNVRAGNHWNYSTATLTFNGRATANSHVPTVSRTNGIISCSTTNCHTGKYNSGTVPAPFWNMTGLIKETANTVGACVKCHAMPPAGYLNHPATLSNLSSMSNIYNRCSTCHNTLSATATNVTNVFTNKATHVDGNVNVVMPCNGCHDYDTRLGGTAWGITNYGGFNQSNGAHVKHIEYLKSRNPGITLDPNNDTYGNATFMAICAPCHPTSTANHSMDQSVNTRQITLTNNGFGGAATYNGTSATSSATNPKSCSNTDCHYRTSPIWSTY